MSNPNLPSDPLPEIFPFEVDDKPQPPEEDEEDFKVKPFPAEQKRRELIELVARICVREDRGENADHLWPSLNQQVPDEQEREDLMCSDEVAAEIARQEKEEEESAAARAAALPKVMAAVRAAEKKEKQRAGRKMKPFKRAKRVSISPETWRILEHYPLYQISSHGRVRALDRAAPDDFLKPRFRWFRGMSVSFIILRDKDGKRRERMTGYLMVSAGFMTRPKWMKD